LALADLIIRAQKEYGITFEAHASGIIASAAVPPFVVCEKRYAAPGTIFMVHEAALWKWPGRESASTISAQNDLMKLLQKRYIAYLLPPRSKLGFDEWALLEKNTTWFDAVKARDEYGIVDIIE
jgi:ATP-dependent protease ClpP protease subunit